MKPQDEHIKIINLVNDNRKIITYYKETELGVILYYPFILNRDNEGKIIMSPYLESYNTNSNHDEFRVDKDKIVFCVGANLDVIALYKEKLNLYMKVKRACL